MTYIGEQAVRRFIDIAWSKFKISQQTKEVPNDNDNTQRHGQDNADDRHTKINTYEHVVD